MEITAKQLRMQPGKIIAHVDSGHEVIITYRGKARARIIPITGKNDAGVNQQDNELFGLWKNKNETKNVEQYVRKIRKGRKF